MSIPCNLHYCPLSRGLKQTVQDFYNNLIIIYLLIVRVFHGKMLTGVEFMYTVHKFIQPKQTQTRFKTNFFIVFMAHLLLKIYKWQFYWANLDNWSGKKDRKT